jgi:colanic acid/amylovoran biosynthesis glycosyltransferase
MSTPETTPSREPLRLAYLTTEYPKVSHTFIRREILELERRGHRVLRLAIRDSQGAIADPADQAEEAKTFHVLRCGMMRLLTDALVVKISHPGRWFSAVKAMRQMSKASERGLIRHLAYLVEAAVLLRVVKREGIQHIHVHFGTNATSVVRLMRLLGGPTYSFTVHGPDEFDAPRGFSLADKVADAAFVVAITDYCSAQLRRWSHWTHWNRIHVVHCTIADAFLNDAVTPIEPASNTLVCVGRLSAQKGQLLLLDAVKRLVDEGVDLHIILAGDGEMREVIEARIAELNLKDTITITGWISEAQVRDHLRAARGLILPSFAEGLPVVIMEALALGRPVLTTRITGIPELVRDGENGWLVPAGNIQALTDTMRTMLQTPAEDLDAMGRAGHVAVQRAHNVTTEVDKLERHFRDAIAAGMER